MNTNIQEIVLQIRQQFEGLLADVLNGTADGPSACQMERDLFARLLEIGKSLFLTFILTQESKLHGVASAQVNGKSLPLHSRRKRSLRTIFGKVKFDRGYYYEDGCGKGYFLLDALLNLPVKSTSDLLREWPQQLSCYVAYRKSGSFMHRFTFHKPSVQAIEDDILEDSKLVGPFYEALPPPSPSDEGCILVAQADGKGIPILSQGKPAEDKARKGKGEKDGRKKEAIATSVYTIDPYVRTAEQVTESLFKVKSEHKPDDRADHKRSGPRFKRLSATLNGKAAAIELLAKLVHQREGTHITARVALTDGAEPLQRRMLGNLPLFTLILDIIHAIEYLWKVANCLFGEKSPRRETWVKERVLRMLSGETNKIISEFKDLASGPRCKKSAQKRLLDVAAYYERNLDYMHYEKYLEAGWPIATGVIEGACRHLVKDRCELSGMRWTVAGAEALLQVRCVAENGDWESFHEFRREQRQIRIYHRPPGSCTALEQAISEAKSAEVELRRAA
jgi:hypothetical protein